MSSTATTLKGRAIRTLKTDEASRAVRELETLTLHQDRFLFLLLCLSRQDGYAYMKQATMARELRCSLRMVEKLVRWAKDKGYLKIAREREHNVYYPQLKNFPFLMTCGFEPANDVDPNPHDVRVHPHDPHQDGSPDQYQAQQALLDPIPIDEDLKKELAAATNRIDDESQKFSRTRQAPTACSSASLHASRPPRPPEPDGSLEVSPPTPENRTSSGTASSETPRPSRALGALPRAGALGLRRAEPSKLLPPELEAALYAIPKGDSALRLLAKEAKSPAQAQRAAQRLLDEHQRVGVPNPGGFMRTILPDFEFEDAPKERSRGTGGATMYRLWTPDQAPPIPADDPHAPKLKPAFRKGSVDYFLQLNAKGLPKCAAS